MTWETDAIKINLANYAYGWLIPAILGETAKKKKKKKKKIDICSFKVDTPGSIKQLDDCFW